MGGDLIKCCHAHACVQGLVRDGHIPVIASVAADDQGQAYNVNADTAAGEIAASLGAEKLILMTDVPGVMIDPKVPDRCVLVQYCSSFLRATASTRPAACTDGSALYCSAVFVLHSAFPRHGPYV